MTLLMRRQHDARKELELRSKRIEFDILREKSTKNIGRRFRRQLPWKGAAFTAAVALFSILTYNDGLSLGYTYGAFALYLVFIFRIDSRIPIAAALLLLAATPFYLIRNLEAFANHLATLAYFFLVIGVIKQFYEYLKK